jgi:hypothetical protein
MKIRTDFVTNSSSESTAEIVIDNPLLLEILCKYKHMGLFTKMEDSLGDGDQLELTQTSFHYYENYGGEGWQRVTDCPRSIVEVLELLLMVMKIKEELDPPEAELFSEMEEEFFRKKDEINSGYEKVVWEFSNDYDSHVIGQFYFDPLSGEKYFYEDERFIVSEDIEVGNNRYVINFSELYDSALSNRGLPRPNEDIPYTTYRARVEDQDWYVDGNSEEEVRNEAVQKLRELSE